MNQLHWVAPLQDHSGYGSATRNYAISILKSGRLDLSLQGVTFETEKTHHIQDQLLRPYFKPDPGARVRVVHLTPENYFKYLRRDAYNIAYTTWETDRLPPSWVPALNMVNEVWVPSIWNLEVFKKSGVTVPVQYIPHAIPIPEIEETAEVTPYEGDDLSCFWFYTIGQWIARKNLRNLLIAYYTEFMNQDDVILALKTYRLNTSSAESNTIRNEITQLKKDLRLPRYPRILFFPKLMTDLEITQLHYRGNCFVLPSRAEGFGIPLAEAMAMGKPTIGTNYGGVLSFMKDRQNSLLVPAEEIPVIGMQWMRLYTGDMLWGEPSIMGLRRAMREMYENRELAAQLGKQAREDIKENFSYMKVGTMIADRIDQIYTSLGK